MTINFDTIEKISKSFALRDRDTMQQRRINKAELLALSDQHVY